MTTAYTNLLGLALPVDGELTGAWGPVINNSITSLIEDAVANFATHDITAGDWTLTTTGSGTSNEARMAMLVVTGTPGTTRTITAPGHSKMYLVSNQSNAAVTVKSASTTGVTVAAGQNTIVAWNNVDFVEIKSTQVLNLAGGSAGKIPYQSAADTTAFTAAGTSGQVLTSNGTSPPTWQSVSSSSANLTGGAASQIPYQSAPSTTTFIANGTSGQVLTSNGAGVPSWNTLPTTISTASNLAGGSAGTIPYQSGSGATSMLAAGTSGYYLKSNGAGAPSWAAVSTSVDTGASSNINGLLKGNGSTLSVATAGTDYLVPSSTAIGTSGSVTLANCMYVYKYDASSTSTRSYTTQNMSEQFGGTAVIISGRWDTGQYCFWLGNGNDVDLGRSGQPVKTIYTQNSVVVVSDKREKTEVTQTLGLDFVKALKPVNYIWKVGGYDTSHIEGEKTAEELLNERVPVPGTRIHAGFFAQDVKEALDTLGKDFGGWVIEDKNDLNSKQMLRLEEFISPIVKAIQEQQVMIEDLQARLAALGG
jgi:hypothetical protein